MLIFFLYYYQRVYVQPQWVFDCINENMILPVDEYLPGAILPPHLSPFVEAGEGDYVPPEKQRLIKIKLGLPVDEEAKATNGNGKEAEKSNGKEKKVEKSDVKSQVKTKPVKKAVPEKKAESDNEDSEEEVNDMKVDLDSPEEEEDDDKEEESDYNSEEEKVVTKKEVKFLINFILFFLI